MASDSTSPDQSAASAATSFEGRFLPWIRGGIALKLVLLFVLAWNTLFVMDEFWQLRQGQFVFNGYFDTMWPGKAVLYALFYKLAHGIGWDAVSIMLAGRLQTALLACATLAILYHCARQMGRDRLRALLVVLAMLCFSTFIERVFRTRSEPLALFFAASALLVLLRGEILKYRAVLLAGFLAGLSFLTTQKAIYFDLALGIALVVDALLGRKLGAAILRGAVLVLGWVLAIAAYCIVFGGLDAVRVLENLFFAPIEGAVHGEKPYGSLRFFVWQTLSRNVILYAACFAGMAFALCRWRQLARAERTALVFTIVIAALVFAHNQPWPYVFIMAIPFLALWIPSFLDGLPAGGSARKAGWLFVLAGCVVSFFVNLAYLRIDNRDQIDLMQRAEKLVGPGDTFFDGNGMLVDEIEIAPWLDRNGILATLAQGERSPAYDRLERLAPAAILTSYRTKEIWPVIGDLVEARYVRVSPNLWIRGRRLEPGKEASFEVVRPGRFRTYSPGGKPVDVPLELEGKSARAPLVLAPGRHTIGQIGGSGPVLLVEEGDYEGVFAPGDDAILYANTY